MNKVVLMGRLTRDPDVRYTQTGKVVTQFTLAVDRPFKSAAGSNAANTIAFCDKCAGTVSRVLNVPMTFERSLDGEAICPHCKTILGDDDDIGYFFDNTFYCEFCGQRLKRGIK